LFCRNIRETLASKGLMLLEWLKKPRFYTKKLYWYSSREPETGVTADAITEVNLAVTTSGTVSFDVFTGDGATTGATIDATRETITAQVGSDLDYSALVSEINKKSGTTGITAMPVS
jgi:hypothetical protein